jgi:hypothetical protein
MLSVCADAGTAGLFRSFQVCLIRYDIRVALNSRLPRVMAQAKTDLADVGS